jgi:Periplasmic binding protein
VLAQRPVREAGDVDGGATVSGADVLAVARSRPLSDAGAIRSLFRLMGEDTAYWYRRGPGCLWAKAGCLIPPSWQPTYQNEARIYAKYLIEHHPNGKIGVLYQNDDYGKDYLQGLKDGLAGKIPIISEQTYESTDPAISSQIISLKGTGADILFDVTLGKFAAQTIRKVVELGWGPVHLLNNVAFRQPTAK